MAPTKVSIEEIRRTLDDTDGNVKMAATTLGISRNSLYERIERAGLASDLEALRAERAAPDREAKTKWRSVHLPREAWERARQAAFDVAYLERQETRPEDVIRTFFAEAFETWLEQRLAKERKAKG